MAEKIDVWCQGVERIENSLIFTLEVDDLPNVEEAEKLVRARLTAAGKKVTAWDVIGVMFYINRENRKLEKEI